METHVYAHVVLSIFCIFFFPIHAFLTYHGKKNSWGLVRYVTYKDLFQMTLIAIIPVVNLIVLFLIISEMKFWDRTGRWLNKPVFPVKKGSEGSKE